MFAVLTARSQDASMWVTGSVQVDSLKSEILGVTRHFSVYIPKTLKLAPDTKLPVLYLLHGINDTHRGWPARGHLADVANQLIASGEMKDMIVVVPDAGSIWNGYFNMNGWSYEDFFFKELIPFVEKKYNCISDKNSRAIAGLSMGGGGSVVFAQRHPEMFCACYSLSGLLDSQEGPIGTWMLRPGDKDLEMKLTELGRTAAALSPVKYLKNANEETAESLRGVKWFVDCGDDDFLLDCNYTFTKEMKAHGIPCEFRVRDGGHTWEYWHSGLYNALQFVSRCFK